MIKPPRGGFSFLVNPFINSRGGLQECSDGAIVVIAGEIHCHTDQKNYAQWVKVAWCLAWRKLSTVSVDNRVS
jgi:hypothetical protein